MTNELVKRPHSKTDYDGQDLDDLVNCIADPLYFMRTFMMVQHPLKGAIPFEPYECQERIINGIHEHRYTIVLAARQIGKALALDTPLPTPLGWTTMGDVRVNDELIGADGQPTKVNFATDVMHGHDCYEVTFDSGEPIKADADHLWTVKSHLIDHKLNKQATLTTREILALLIRAKERGNSVFIDMPMPLTGAEVALPVAPYTLGLWLGDGASADGRLHGDSIEMRSHVTADGFAMSDVKCDSRNDMRFQTIYGLRSKLVTANTFKNKHIPDIYLRASIDQRIELLRGLMDTDSYARPKDGNCEITQKSARLADGICELLASLGIKAHRSIKIVKGNEYHRIGFATCAFEVFKLKRKLLNQQNTPGQPQLRRIYFQSIKKTASVPVRCIQVEAKDHLFLCGKMMIPTHNTTCAAGYLLWRAMFVPDTVILVTANKYLQALEVMDRVRYAYENLPDHIRAGATEYNKGSVTFDNGSRIVARATSADAGRGLAVSLLYCDELAFVPPGKQIDFWTSIQPVLSTGGSCIVTSTPKNDEDQFAQIWKGAQDNTDEFGNTLPDGIGKNGFFPVLAPWWEHPERDEAWAKPFRESLGEARFRQEFCGEFISDDDTLLNPMLLARLQGRDPIFYTGTIRWYAEPAPNRTYLVALDPSLGMQNDYGAIEIFQLPEMIQVAEWQNNMASPRRQVAIMMEALYALDGILRENPLQIGDPDIYWTFENNTIGESILTIIEDTGEERFPGSLVTERRRKGLQMKRVRKGLYTAPKPRLSSLARLKSLLESERMVLHSRNLIKELKNFVSVGATFKAKQGEHDDLVMATSLIVRMIDIVLAWGTSSGDGDLREYIGDEELGLSEIEPMPVVI